MVIDGGPDANAHLLAIIAGSDDAIISTRLDGTITTWNQGAERLYGYLAEDALGKNIVLVYPESEQRSLIDIIARVGRGESIELLDVSRRRRDGTLVTVEVRITPLVNKQGATIGASAITRDVTLKNQHQEELRQSRAFLERTQEIGHIGSWEAQIGPEAVLQLTAESYRILGVEPGSHVRNFDFFNMVVPGDRLLLTETFIRTRSEQTRTEFEVRIVRPDLVERWIYLAVDAIVDVTGATIGLTGVVQDITERKEFEAALLHDALHDPLTGLPNRVLFLDRVDRALTRANLRGSKVAILYADIDRFELFNDTKGHDQGDELLRAVADRLEASIAPTDSVARFTADEFVIMCEGISNLVDATERAAQAVASFSEPFDVSSGRTFVTVSVGVAVSEPNVAPADLVRDADLAMHRAKESGSNHYELYDLNLRRQAEQRVAFEEGLRRALENGELFLEYQPIISLVDDRYVGAEALIRWRHPERGIIYPDDFIGVAEETGLIIAIGAWVIEEACRELRRWVDAEPETAAHLHMSVNVSPLQLRDESFLPLLAETIARASIQGSSLKLELTESVLVDPLLSHDVLHAIRNLGPRLSIDDFGTKYSALAYLTQLPIDELKIDRFFVGNAGEDESDRAIVTAIVALGQSLRLHVVAEGVETKTQLELLRGLGCDSAQGRYFAAPLSGDACLAWLLGDSARAID